MHIGDEESVAREGHEAKPTGYAWYALGILSLTYTLNFIDKQMLSVLAEPIKRDLRLTDGDLGFLYGTAFAVFYTLFGIPMGRLADAVRRTRLLSVGLGVWSMMTALSGMARTAPQLAAARFGVGIGEATSAPTAYSLLSDYFPKAYRATALAIYAAGLYVGAGVSMFIGGAIVEAWSGNYRNGSPLGLVGWQAAFLAVGIPGLLLAFWVASLNEPARGDTPAGSPTKLYAAVQLFFEEVMSVLPPLTLIDAFRRGAGALALNVGSAVAITGAALFLGRVTGDHLQWATVGLGVYAIWNWTLSLRRRDPTAFAAIFCSPSFMSLVIGYAFVAWSSYSFSFWSIPYAVRTFGVSLATAGLIIGGTSAVAGALGAVAGGRVADLLRRRYASGRIMVALFAAIVPPPLIAVAFTTDSLTLFYALQFPISAVIAMALGACTATTQDLVAPRMRGTAIAVFYTGLTMIGLALGPYSVGRVSEWTGSLGQGLLSTLLVAPIAIGSLAVAARLISNSSDDEQA